MYSLKTDLPRYYRVKSGQTKEQTEENILSPVNGEVFAGKIIKVYKNLKVYYAEAGDSYMSIAEKFSVDINALTKLNGERYVYPRALIFIPQDTDEKECGGI